MFLLYRSANKFQRINEDEFRGLPKIFMNENNMIYSAVS